MAKERLIDVNFNLYSEVTVSQMTCITDAVISAFKNVTQECKVLDDSKSFQIMDGFLMASCSKANLRWLQEHNYDYIAVIEKAIADFHFLIQKF